MAYKEIEPEQSIWIPTEEGEILEGEVIKCEEGLFGKQLTIKKADGTAIKTPSHKILQARLDNVNEGDRLRITYKGMEPSKKPGFSPARIYKVEVDVIEEEKV